MYERLERSVKKAMREAISVENLTRLLIEDGWTKIATREPKAPEYHSCESCEHYSRLAEARVRSDGAVIYGYCFRDGDKDYSTNIGKGFAVFIPEGCCKRYKRKKEKKNG